MGAGVWCRAVVVVCRWPGHRGAASIVAGRGEKRTRLWQVMRDRSFCRGTFVRLWGDWPGCRSRVAWLSSSLTHFSFWVAANWSLTLRETAVSTERKRSTAQSWGHQWTWRCRFRWIFHCTCWRGPWICRAVAEAMLMVLYTCVIQRCNKTRVRMTIGDWRAFATTWKCLWWWIRCKRTMPPQRRSAWGPWCHFLFWPHARWKAFHIQGTCMAQLPRFTDAVNEVQKRSRCSGYVSKTCLLPWGRQLGEDCVSRGGTGLGRLCDIEWIAGLQCSGRTAAPWRLQSQGSEELTEPPKEEEKRVLWCCTEQAGIVRDSWCFSTTHTKWYDFLVVRTYTNKSAALAYEFRSE